MLVEIGLLAYLLDRVFGEFPIKHPVVFMGDYIKWFEEKFYRDDVLRGTFLTITLILITFTIIHSIDLLIGFIPTIYIQTLLFAIIASTTISAKMLYESVKDIMVNPKNIRYLVSRDT
ncbi:MAG TPA: cobalamin biosynthesis protein CobD, partial [Campylobacterales bacterium]|nr:cobalamin biosynthesis protein CobD [Campylobacterales bacterium]